MAKDPTKKSKTLRRRNINRRTGAKAQSKQIMALSRTVSKMNREQLDRVRTCWQRNNLPIGSGGAIATPYICPIPYAMCDPLGASPVPNATVWSDNRVIASQPTFSKRLVFGYAEASAGSNKIYHTGGKLRYQIFTEEPSYTKLTLCLIRAKKKQADQLITDRDLKASSGGGQAGSASKLYDDVDYTVHNGNGGTLDTWYGAEINRKYWDVLYTREVALGAIKDLSASNVTRVTPVTRPKNNSLVATGTIPLPAGGEIKAVGYATTQNESPATAMEQQYLDQRNEDSCYLVAINNDLQIDLQNISMGFVVTDYYKAVV
ncbi:MAG: putative capsid protein [Cressdnaviricota sp.]|nr:MAG: putative capsid protein [Cressdnaviricota sp.]